jgi:hypothetical protein
MDSSGAPVLIASFSHGARAPRSMRLARVSLVETGRLALVITVGGETKQPVVEVVNGKIGALAPVASSSTPHGEVSYAKMRSHSVLKSLAYNENKNHNRVISTISSKFLFL